jgi:hypothetical protein
MAGFLAGPARQPAAGGERQAVSTDWFRGEGRRSCRAPEAGRPPAAYLPKGNAAAGGLI